MRDVANFSAGPAKMFSGVAETVSAHIRNGVDSGGVPLLELPDRSKSFTNILDRVGYRVRKLLAVPDDFATLIMMGGGTVQFGLLALNLIGVVKKIGFVESDFWTIRAREEFSAVLPAHVIATSEKSAFRHLPKLAAADINGDIEAVFLTSNNTAAGTQWYDLPTLPAALTIVDASSDIFTRQVNFKTVDVLFACAQKNFGIAGTSLVIIRRSLLERFRSRLPGALSYRAWEATDNRYCTLPVVNIAIMDTVLSRLESAGGVDTIAREAACKARLISDFLDGSPAFLPFADASDRSMVNVTFHSRSGPAVDLSIAQEAEAIGIIGLKGHPHTRGLRASLYPAVTTQNVVRLVRFLESLKDRSFDA